MNAGIPFTTARPPSPKPWRLAWLLGCLTAQFFLTACRTVTLPPADLAAPGWQTRTGQAVWRPSRNAPELAGEILIATRPDGQGLVQFTKNPFPIVVAQTTGQAWQIEFSAAGVRYAGPGRPPKRLVWFQLFELPEAGARPGVVREIISDPQHRRLENPATGEALEIFLTP